MTNTPQSTVISAGESPLYVEIYRLLRRKIAAKEWQLGEKLPPLEKMATTYGVTRTTLRKAISLLERDGMVECRQGKGSFVSAKIQAARFTPSATVDWATLANSSGIGISKEIAPPTETEAPVPNESASAELRGAKLANQFVRLHLLAIYDQQPVVLSDTFLDKAIYERHRDAFREGNILSTIGGINEIEISHGFYFMTISTADVETAQHLAVSINSPIGETDMWLVDNNNTVVYASTHRFPSDFVKFRFDLAINP